MNVYVYEDDLRPNGAPAGDPLYELECTEAMMISEPKSGCAPVLLDHAQLFALPDLSLSASVLRVAVNASWSEPRLKGPDPFGVDYGAWLFTVEAS